VKVSALIPTYNRRAHTIRAIDSVLAQTMPVDEIIVVDDGSTDGTAEAISSQYGTRVVLLKQENAGVSAARNLGARAARGEWIGFLDSDDVWSPEKLTRQFDAIASMGSRELLACFTDCSFVGNSAMHLSAFQNAGLRSTSVFGVLEDPAGYVLSTRPVMFVQSLLIRRSLLMELGGFDESMVVSEDTDLLFRMAIKTKVCFVAEQLVQIDRTPSRESGLSELYASRDDRVFNSLAHLYLKLLMIPEVSGTTHEQSIRELQRLLYFDSAEAKLHQLRVRAALEEIGRLKALGESYKSLLNAFISRKINKVRLQMRGRDDRHGESLNKSRADLV
jgi:glycosyltransferase involved in cell wall biosynthesis